MSILRKWVGLVFLGLLPLLAGCSRHSTSEHYYLIATNIKLPYWQTAAAGFAKAAGQYGVTAEMLGPDNFDPVGEVKAFLRQPLVLSAMEEMTSREVAAVMGIPEGTVRTRGMRARAELKKRVEAMEARR